MSRPLRYQRGTALLIAVFLIVVIALVGSMIALTSTTQQITSGRNLEATGAFYAARAKLDREIKNVADTNGLQNNCPGAVTTNTSFTTKREVCDPVPVEEGGADYTVFFLRISAEKGSRASGTHVRRELEAVVTNQD